MNREKQVVKKGIWHIGGKKRKRKKQKGGAIPLGLFEKPIFKKIFGRGKRKKRWSRRR